MNNIARPMRNRYPYDFRSDRRRAVAAEQPRAAASDTHARRQSANGSIFRGAYEFNSKLTNANRRFAAAALAAPSRLKFTQNYALIRSFITFRPLIKDARREAKRES